MYDHLYPDLQGGGSVPEVIIASLMTSSFIMLRTINVDQNSSKKHRLKTQVVCF